jgi:multiple sugar transport system substrate-binding protein
MWGGHVYNEDGSRCTVDSPEAIEAVKFLHDLIYVHHVMPSPVEETMAAGGGWGSGTITFFSGAKGAMAIGGRWWLCTLRQTPGLRLGAVPCPYGPGKVYRGYGRATLMNSGGKHKKEALEFLQYLAGPDYNQLLNDQADALAPVKAYCQGDRFLHNPAHPEEDYNATWREVMDSSVPDRVSPYVNGNVANRILNKQLDLVKGDLKTAEDALHDAARLVNAEIDKNRRHTADLAAEKAQGGR